MFRASFFFKVNLRKVRRFKKAGDFHNIDLGLPFRQALPLENENAVAAALHHDQTSRSHNWRIDPQFCNYDRTRSRSGQRVLGKNPPRRI